VYVFNVRYDLFIYSYQLIFLCTCTNTHTETRTHTKQTAIQFEHFTLLKVQLSCNTPCRCWRAEEVQFLFILDLSTWREGGWSGQHRTPVMFYPHEMTPGTHWIESWVGFSASLDTEATGKILCPYQGSNPDCPVPLTELT